MKLLKKILSIVAALSLLLCIVPAASAETDMDALYKDKSWDQVIEEFFLRHGIDHDRITLGYYNTVTGEEHYYQPDKYMVGGSVYKVPLNMAYAERIYNGEMDWKTLVPLYEYQYMMEESIINSNNDLSGTLMFQLGGSYQGFLNTIAPYLGVDPETVDNQYYNERFTARQMITCLKTLYEGGDRFPKIIETMQKAEPNNYFKRDEQRFNIGHKYGFWKEEYHLYMNDIGIAYTDDPILIVMFTDNVENAYTVMTEYCTLMCDYAQYNTAIRIEQEEQARREEEARIAAEKAEAEAAEMAQAMEELTVKETEETEMGTSSLIGIAAAIAFVMLGCAAVIICKRKFKINAFWALLAVILSGVTMLMCIIGTSAGTIIAKPEGDPKETVVEFMDALTGGDYSTAYACLSGYSSLGLEKEPADEVGKMVFDALKESYSYELYGDCIVNKLQAHQQVQLTYLNLPSIAADVEAETTVVLNGIVQSRPRAQVYDANNKYLPEVTQEAYSTAVATVLKDADEYYSVANLLLEIEYTDGKWQIVPGQDLINAIVGGTAKK